MFTTNAVEGNVVVSKVSFQILTFCPALHSKFGKNVKSGLQVASAQEFTYRSEIARPVFSKKRPVAQSLDGLPPHGDWMRELAA